VATDAIHGYSLISVSVPPTILDPLFLPHLHPDAVVAPAVVVDCSDIDGVAVVVAGEDCADDDGDAIVDCADVVTAVVVDCADVDVDAVVVAGEDGADDDGDAAVEVGEDDLNVLEGGTTLVVICWDTVPL